ncbi:MAG: indole-3-glycerol-phosphate synthase [Candidatus Bathyarchaeota archaeon]|nr:indole-3-glycerol-phosphate synthase [Candidatus Bathyarchaeota archaeon]MCX8177881.1 indole-3-glycerol-phosphate synthase [Candidatus Bathyarchaeota archaeon]MDW8193582.1 indole-3-glycerol-phosphate synthase [Nitrososphaerota archaeon]
MADFLDTLIIDAFETVRSGYYNVETENTLARLSLKEAIARCRYAPIIAEIKPASPSIGRLRHISSPVEVAKAMEAGGATGISVLTEPKHFDGSLPMLAHVKKHVSLPVIMKDIIVDPIQIEAAAGIGADAILLIYRVFEKTSLEHSLEDFIQLAHSCGLEVLLETHTREEFAAAVRTEADLVGINNRNLRTLKVNLNTTRAILSSQDCCGKVVVSESGIRTAEDIRLLRSYGAEAFLVGSAIMAAENIEEKVKELVAAYEKG